MQRCRWTATEGGRGDIQGGRERLGSREFSRSGLECARDAYEEAVSLTGRTGRSKGGYMRGYGVFGEENNRVCEWNGRVSRGEEEKERGSRQQSKPIPKSAREGGHVGAVRSGERRATRGRRDSYG